MTRPLLFVLLVSSLLPLAAAADLAKRDFEADAVGQPPAGFELARTGGGAEGKWIVRTEKGADKNHVLAQESADTTDNRFPVAVLKDGSYKDVVLSVRARTLAGHVDQAFGLVWRYKDANNYYVTRCNALEDNCRVYHVVNGSRRQFGNQDLKVAANTWHTVKVQATGNRFVVFFDGNRVFDGTDDTFKEAGKVGLWTKADSVIEFDDFTVEGRDASRDAAPLRLVQTIPMPGVEGRIDHLAIDLSARRLFVCALGNGTLEVVDLEKGQRVQSITGFKEPQGIVFMPKTKAVVVASGGDGHLSLLEGPPFKVTKTLSLGDDADNVRYDPEHERIYVGYGGGALAIVDALTRERIGEIPLEAHPESFQRESSGRIFVNEARRARVAVVDVAKKSVTSRWELGGPAANYPMALDEAHHRLFVGTRQPPRLIVLDTETGKVAATLETEADVDDVFYDAARRRVYVIGGGGSVVVYDQASPDRYVERARVRTVEGARTGLFSPESGQLFVAVPHRANPVAEIRVFAAAP